MFHLRKSQSNFLLSNLLYWGGEGAVTAAAATLVLKCLSAFAMKFGVPCFICM